MNAFTQPVLPGFFHTTPPQFHDESDLPKILSEFSYDTDHEYESDCQAWGAHDIVLPAKCWDQFFDMMKNDEELYKRRQRGKIHMVNIQEEIEGDEVNTVTLAAGFLDIQQRIVFYDLPANQATA